MSINLEMVRGDSKSFLFALGMDLTGAVGIWMTAKSALADADPGVFQKSDGAGITVIDDAAGTIQVDVDPADTDSLDAVTNRLYYDVQVEDVNNKVSTRQSGRLIVRPDVTTTVSGS
jgi:hypothetical protein